MHVRCITTDKRLGAALFFLALLASPVGAQNSGFLTGYSKLAPAADNPNTSLWISQNFDFKPCRKILLDQVEVFVNPTSEYQGVSPDVLNGMADRFRDLFKQALQPDYQFVDEVGPGVLHIRLAITGVNLVQPGFQVANVLPVLFVLRTISGAN